MTTPETNKRSLILNTLQQLHDSTGDDRVRAHCTKQMNDVQYAAPELLDYRWHQVYELLQTFPPWPGSVELWNTAHNVYNGMCTL